MKATEKYPNIRQTIEYINKMRKMDITKWGWYEIKKCLNSEIFNNQKSLEAFLEVAQEMYEEEIVAILTANVHEVIDGRFNYASPSNEAVRKQLIYMHGNVYKAFPRFKYM